MCGILFFLKQFSDTMKGNDALQHRGPETTSTFENSKIGMTFNRLKINDESENGNQPMVFENNVLICNGEIFNHKELEATFSFQMNSRSDCEVILHLYNHFKKDDSYTNIYEIMAKVCEMLDGEFAFVLFDPEHDFVFFGRDRYGVRPMFFDTNTYSFASEAKAFVSTKHVQQFPPGHFALLSNYSNLSYIFPYVDRIGGGRFSFDDESTILAKIKTKFVKAVEKRMMSDRNVCALLSGGLDSSLVCAILAKKYPGIQTFSIGMKGSPDLKFAQVVADHIKSNHTSVELDKSEFIQAIEEVIFTIESYDTTTVRASVGNYLIAKYIANNSDCKVVFNGDYSDEVCGGYKYFKKCNDPNEFHDESCRLVNDICYFDSLRSDRTISRFGLEARVPFADTDFVQFYLSIHPSLRMSKHRIEKYLLRKAFDDELEPLLPPSVLWREKEAFSDGVSIETESWSDIITAYVENLVDQEEFDKSNFSLKETFFYYSIYKKHFDGDLIPYLWMPKFCNETVNDPSARKL